VFYLHIFTLLHRHTSIKDPVIINANVNMHLVYKYFSNKRALFKGGVLTEHVALLVPLISTN
jgi:hypothetical protein